MIAHPVFNQLQSQRFSPGKLQRLRDFPPPLFLVPPGVVVGRDFPAAMLALRCAWSVPCDSEDSRRACPDRSGSGDCVRCLGAVKVEDEGSLNAVEGKEAG